MKRILLALALAFAAIMTIAPTATARDNYDRRLVVINNSSVDIVEIYISNVGSSRWGRDLLGRGILSSGYYVVLDAEDYTGYCRYDLMAITEYGEKIIEPGVNLCVVESWTIG